MDTPSDSTNLPLTPLDRLAASRRRFLALAGAGVGAGARAAGLVRSAHRSTPPITGSMLATAAITSAIIPPSHIAATA